MKVYKRTISLDRGFTAVRQGNRYKIVNQKGTVLSKNLKGATLKKKLPYKIKLMRKKR